MQFLDDLGLDDGVFGVAAGIAFITAVGAIGGALSPSIVGLLKTHTGSLYMGFSAIAVLLVVGMLALLWIVPANLNAGRLR